MPRVVVAALVLTLLPLRADAEGGAVPVGAAANRTGWFYASGALRNVVADRWEETNATGASTYQEVDRNEHYVELYDKGRKLSYRLYGWGMYGWNRKTEKWHLVRAGRWDDPRKRPLDPALNSGERAHLEAAGERLSFPRLGDDFEVLAPASAAYNCIAWALGRSDRWVWPVPPGQPVSVGDFDALFSAHGYRRVGPLNYDPQAGHDKLVLYAKRNEFGEAEPTHCARQLADGSWSSKLGRLPLIRHLHPDDIDGGTYGEAHAVYVRERPKR
ncbi:MAG: hypothetical protein U0797_18620 [Gemmataceae bacterium]